MKKVLVTGSSGYLGSWIVRTLLESGYEVRAAVRSEEKYTLLESSLLSENVPIQHLSHIKADLKSASDWDNATAGIEYVIHTATPMGGDDGDMDSPTMIPIAKKGVRNIFSAALKAGVKRIVMTSSGAANFPPEGTKGIIDEAVWSDPEDPRLGNYMRSKTISEMEAWSLIRSQNNMELVTILPDAIMGPFFGGRGNRTDNVYRPLLTGNPIPETYFPISDVRDLARLHILAMEAPKASGQRIYARTADLMMPEIATIIREGVKELSPHISAEILTAGQIREMAKTNPAMAAQLTSVDVEYRRTNQKAKDLGWTYHSGKDTVLDHIHYLISNQLL